MNLPITRRKRSLSIARKETQQMINKKIKGLINQFLQLSFYLRKEESLYTKRRKCHPISN